MAKKYTSISKHRQMGHVTTDTRPELVAAVAMATMDVMKNTPA